MCKPPVHLHRQERKGSSAAAPQRGRGFRHTYQKSLGRLSPVSACRYTIDVTSGIAINQPFVRSESHHESRCCNFRLRRGEKSLTRSRAEVKQWWGSVSDRLNPISAHNIVPQIESALLTQQVQRVCLPSYDA